MSKMNEVDSKLRKLEEFLKKEGITIAVGDRDSLIPNIVITGDSSCRWYCSGNISLGVQADLGYGTELVASSVSKDDIDTMFDSEDLSNPEDGYKDISFVSDIRCQGDLEFGDIISFAKPDTVTLEDTARMHECSLEEAQDIVDSDGYGLKHEGKSFVYIGDNRFLDPEDISKKKFKAINELRKLINSESIELSDIEERLPKE